MWKRLLSFLKTSGRTAAEESKSLSSEAEIDPYNPFPNPVEIPITDVIDLHTIPPRDVKAVVEEYLHQAHEAGFPVVRIIHGKGIGVQRAIVRSILERAAYVQSWTDASPDAGGIGATMVSLYSKVNRPSHDLTGPSHAD